MCFLTTELMKITFQTNFEKKTPEKFCKTPNEKQVTGYFVNKNKNLQSTILLWQELIRDFLILH